MNTGECERKIVEPEPICSNDPPKEVKCFYKRPTEKECPILNYIRAPDLVYCGVDKNGNKQGFARPCEVCKDERYDSYFDGPCE